MNTQISCFDIVQGSAEARSKAYKRYVARALEALTPQYTKNGGGMLGLAKQQVATTWSLDV